MQINCEYRKLNFPMSSPYPRYAVFIELGRLENQGKVTISGMQGERHGKC